MSKFKYDLTCIVRFTNLYSLCQVIYPSIFGDIVFQSSSSKVLTLFGNIIGFKNLVSSYFNSLICALKIIMFINLYEKFTLNIKLDIGYKFNSFGSRAYVVIKVYLYLII